MTHQIVLLSAIVTDNELRAWAKYDDNQGTGIAIVAGIVQVLAPNSDV
jgi:hypothetical protein